MGWIHRARPAVRRVAHHDVVEDGKFVIADLIYGLRQFDDLLWAFTEGNAGELYGSFMP